MEISNWVYIPTYLDKICKPGISPKTHKHGTDVEETYNKQIKMKKYCNTISQIGHCSLYYIILKMIAVGLNIHCLISTLIVTFSPAEESMQSDLEKELEEEKLKSLQYKKLGGKLIKDFDKSKKK